MSGIVGVFSSHGSHSGGSIVRKMLARMPGRGGDRTQLWSDAGAVLGVTRYSWEMARGFSDDVLVAGDGRCTVAADASIFYRGDLRRQLEQERVPASADTASHLILAAYRAWGPECVDRLEGDWAFILWDARDKQVFCSRDFGGRRPLFYADLGDALIVASTVSAVLAHPRCGSDLNVVAVAADAAGLFAVPHETAFRDVSALPAGSSLEHRRGTSRIWRHWFPPPVRDAGGPHFEEAAEHLRVLLTRSVAERLSPIGPTSVWLSGGWDSTAIFGAGQQALREQGNQAHLRPVSISYPPGDPGREVKLITSVAEHWGAPVHWLDIRNIPLLDRPAERAAVRDEPFAHAFEMGTRALAQGSRSVGTHVGFDGSGGDQLFQVSLVYLADLFRTGRWHRLVRECRGKGLGRGDLRTLFRWVVQPVLPGPVLAAARVVRGGRALRGYLDRPVPEWIAPDFARRHGLLERELRHTPRRTGGDLAAHETQRYLTHAFYPRVSQRVCGFALENGVEMRAPLYDRRIIEFALSRPVSERSSGREIKRLLRRSMRGLLPDKVLEPRRYHTGTTGGYLDRSLRKTHAPLLETVFQSPLALAELGVVDGATLRRRWSEFLEHGGGNLGVNLFLTFQAELWLRARRSEARGVSSPLFGISSLTTAAAG